jgi:hypothetical protein
MTAGTAGGCTRSLEAYSVLGVELHFYSLNTLFPHFSPIDLDFCALE